MAEHSGARLRPYFEGWYFKHQAGGRSLALIPGVSRDGLGGGQAFIQVLTDTASYFVPYPVEAFAVRRAPLGVRVGRAVFTGEGMREGAAPRTARQWQRTARRRYRP